MAKDIKAIQCPKCGSTYKKEIKPDFYQCQNCQTEYFLDSDDVHHYYHHDRVPPLQNSAPPVNSKLPVYILLGAIAFIAIAYITTMLFQTKINTTSSYTNSTYKIPRSYYSSYVYTNTATNNPVYLRIGVDYINNGNNKSYQELHAQFNNALDGKLIADRIITDERLRNDRCALTFKTYSPDMIYAIGCNSTLLELDTRNNRLIDITKSTFKDYPKLSSGVAKLDFDYRKAMIKVMSNEGEAFYYFPTIKKLVSNEEQANAVEKQLTKKNYCEFTYANGDFDKLDVLQLFEIKYDAGRILRREVTPGRKYFSPIILYQDANHLLIVVNTTAAPDPPKSVQLIDTNTGKILWALSPDNFNLFSTTKCKQGFALEYRKDEEADYVHGVMVISDGGKLVYNYQLARTE
ncbi:hypothetical protein [Mucilaginibacter polytrichastri]|uniref:C2H2-type domain-containing protein n=1 Tax=Mucilaginibacter polytrichastri TaxID=1302689 RepID=A0A1Q6A0E0_9SPHI|nr:hypothetical protein [Mucilaginibacter polytrichastri]OKS87451.1 hypothetical protein RG47T_2912 [Mucilaginibacter polytrichastri]SFS90799.1 hypothetical protein SAMN04487890_10647 [Mucilaginibacter polytrichastri]